MNKLNLFVPVAVLPLLGMAQEKAARPNIVLFLVDDMGWQDSSVPFWKQKTALNEQFETPNMERLAAQGMKFTQAYAASVSSPSRISLFTGMNSARHCVTNWTLRYNQSTDGKDKVLNSPQWNVNGMCCEPGVPNTVYATSLAQLLKDNGYQTIHCGKAHFGAISTPAANPLNIGFDVNIAGHAAGGLASYLGEQNYGNTGDPAKPSPFAVPGLEKYHGTGTFVTEALTIEALKSLDNARTVDKPFFLYMSHYAVHIPINKDARYYQKYIDKGLSPTEAAYAGLVEGMDKSLGDIMNYLEKTKQADNTIIIFMSDNGGLAATARGGVPHTQNKPLNSGKGSLYEGGIREPMLVAWPGKVKPASVCDEYLIVEDFFPSILEMAGVKKYKTVQKTDGKSFVPLLTQSGNPAKGRKLYWNYPNNWGVNGPGINFATAVRDGDWKLVYYYKTGKKELFNIREDIGEQNDLSVAEPKKTKRLSRELGRYLRESGAQRPVFKDTGKPAPWPDEVTVEG